MKRLLTALPILALITSCTKEPGEGGKAEIRGRVIEQEYSNGGLPIGDPYPVPGNNVYIVYGDASDGAYPDDNVDTGPNGEFRFPWLRKGTYTIYTLSDCATCDGGTKTIYATADIGDKKEVVNVGDMLIEKR
ncbi:MAG: hypothetical protein JNL43_09100 [Flavobacteriales bacterium]|nr:hypothetical protein [Flavobacteriales bacterium]HRH69988.1 hypothetical protein [Flavobacteriales bacterium]